MIMKKRDITSRFRGVKLCHIFCTQYLGFKTDSILMKFGMVFGVISSIIFVKIRKGKCYYGK